MTKRDDRFRMGGITLLLLFGVLAWDASGLDLRAAALFGTAAGFPLKDHWLFSAVLHEGARIASWLFALALCVGVWWPAGPLRSIEAHRRVQILATALLSVALVSGFKSISATSCPWDLAAFGRTATYVSHWQWATGGDGGSGHCFPAGHASAGFAFLGGFFALRDREPRLARRWLSGAIAVGCLLGLAQQARGAHFASHTLWTAWLCWLVAFGLDCIWSIVLGRSSSCELEDSLGRQAPAPVVSSPVATPGAASVPAVTS